MSEQDPADSTPTPQASSDTAQKPSEQGDASRSEVAIYAFGNVEGAVADRFPEILQNILIVVLHMNPLLLGLVMGIRTLWDGIMDPIMAHISDNTRSRWGRRRPYILVGGVARCLFLLPFIALIPLGDQATGNSLMEAQKFIQSASTTAEKNYELLGKAYRELPEADADKRAKLVDVLEGRPPQSWISQIIRVFSADEDKSVLTQSQQALEQIKTYRPTLESDAEVRREKLAEAQSAVDALKAKGLPEENPDMMHALGQLAVAEQAVKVADELLAQSVTGERQAVANSLAVRYLLNTYSQADAGAPTSLEQAQSAADATLSARGLETIELFPAEAPIVQAVTEAKEKRTIPEFISDSLKSIVSFDWLRSGIDAFKDPSNYNQRSLVIYLLIAYLIFATLSTINAAPYYALGIELSPSYEGRTQVVVYRSVMNKIVGLLGPWVPVFCFLPYFANAFDALFWVAVGVCVVGIPSTVLMFFKTRERTQATIKKAGNRPNLFKSMWEIGRQPDFLRVLFLFVFVGLVNGLFQQVSFFLNVYWVTGSALSGATLLAQVSLVAWGLSLVSLPVIKWACDKFQKHRVLQFSIIWMSIGSALKWWLMNPEHPEYQYILPFFFSLGIASVYTVLPALMADVTDMDELKYGVRREGMFGAVMGFLMKLIGTATPIAAGAILVISGFDASLEYHQHADTIINMRLMDSLIPASMLLISLLILRKYPLTRERVADIKEQLKQRHSQEDAAEAAQA